MEGAESSSNPLLGRYRLIVYGALALAIAGGVLALLTNRPEPATITIIPPEPTAIPSATPIPSSTPTPGPFLVYITGAVERPNALVTLEYGSRVVDALRAAGGSRADADLDRAAESAAHGICYNTGQSCGALSRVLIPKQNAEAVVARIQQTLRSVRLGSGVEDPDMGPLISSAQLERVLGYVQLGESEGAKVLFGGRRPEGEQLSKGFFIEPTLFADAKPGMRIVEEEIFGPVMAAITFDSEEEAVELANASNYGLSAEIWTQNLSRAHRVARQLDVSHVTVNGGGGFGIQAPFGGVKQSGFGREGGWDSILQYSRVKNVWINL